MGFFSSIGNFVKGAANTLNPVKAVKNIIKDPIHGLTDAFTTFNPVTGLYKAGLGGLANTGDNWASRGALNILAKGEHMMNTPATWLGLTDSADGQYSNRLNEMNYKRSDSSVSSFNTGLGLSGSGETQLGGNVSGVGAGGAEGGGGDSLGRSSAIEPDTVLDASPDNYNNFVF